MICPNTYTDVLLTESKFVLSASQFAALAFRSQPLVHPGIGRCDVSFTLHEGWVQMTLYCRDDCAGLAALAWDQNGNVKATKFMANMAAVTRSLVLGCGPSLALSSTSPGTNASREGVLASLNECLSNARLIPVNFITSTHVAMPASSNARSADQPALIRVRRITARASK